MARRRTITTLSEADIEAFIRQATLLFDQLRPYAIKLRTDTEHYRAVSDLQSKIAESIQRVTGKPAPWVTAGVRQCSSESFIPSKI